MTTKPKTTTRKKTTTVKSKSTIELPPNPFIFEILALVNKQRTKAKKVEVLKKYEHDSLKAIFIWNFDETVISLLPSGEVPYSSLKDEQVTTGTLSTKISHAVGTMEYLQSDSMGLSDMKKGKTTIRKEWTKFYNFCKGGNDSLKSLRRETMFINILEGLHPLDAEILCLVKDKELESKYNITKEIVSEAYPDITWGGRS
jgi:hypothetical protein|tara:strand:+ start:32 stop:631 length:600 start_codon:yes stop_codon:yes gene_type:complete